MSDLQSRIHAALINNPVLAARRKNRAAFMLKHVEVPPAPGPFKVLDVGCGVNGRSFADYMPDWFEVLGIDLLEPSSVNDDHPNFTYRQQDATNMDVFEDDAFDLVVSVGMMEHICEPSVLDGMAREIHRVGKQYVIIVPWRYAWIEPHFKFPFFQLLPYELKLQLTQRLNLHRLADRVKEDPTFIRRHYQWPTSAEWKRIWPESEVFLSPTLETIAIVKSTMNHR